MKSPFTSTGLNEAGRAWLKAPVNIPTQQLPITEWIRQIARTFSLSTREALLVLCAMFSAAAGPAGLVRDPFGRAIPLSLQLLVYGGAASNLSLAMNVFGQSVLEGFNKMIGRRLPDIVISNANQKAGEANQRKKQIFPVGGILTTRMAEELIKEDRDCAFASLSDSMALRAFSKIPKDRQTEFDQFITAGWSGDGIAGTDGHPIFPAISLTWSASTPVVTSALTDGLLDRLPGLLLASPMHISPDAQMPAPLHQVTMTKWATCFIMIMEELRMPHKPKHTIRPSAPLREMSDEALNTVAGTASFVTRYTDGDGAAAQLLRQAPVQITKLAGLLSLHPVHDATIQPVYVQYAQEIYRWLVASTLRAVEQTNDLRPGSLRQERTHVETKLSLYGAMSLRQLAAEQPKQEPGKVQIVLRSLMEERAVTCDSEGLYSLLKTGAPAETPQDVATA